MCSSLDDLITDDMPCCTDKIKQIAEAMLADPELSIKRAMKDFDAGFKTAQAAKAVAVAKACAGLHEAAKTPKPEPIRPNNPLCRPWVRVHHAGR